MSDMPKHKKYNNVEARRYGNENELIKPEWIDPGSVLWFVNGRYGRKPIIVPDTDDSEERAMYEYFKRYEKTGGTENE